LERIDQIAIPEDTDEVRLFMVGVEAESIIPSLIEYYFKLGIDRVFYIDNLSSDSSIQRLLKYSKVHIWKQTEEYGIENKYGVTWQEDLLQKYGIGNWVLLADTDEWFIYPNCETKSLRAFTAELEAKGIDCVVARFIDMYGKDAEALIQPHQTFLEVMPYYDRNEFGCRNRCLGFKPFYLKYPLFKFQKSINISAGFHKIMGNKGKTYPIICGILHFKFALNFKKAFDFHKNKMPGAFFKNQIYEEGYQTKFYHPRHSQKFVGSSDLVFFQQYSLDDKRFTRLRAIDKVLSKSKVTKWLVKYSQYLPL
jgi:hypothetical protein